MSRVLSEAEKKEIYEHIRQVLSEELGVPLEKIGPETKIIDDLGGDSMLYLEMVEDFKKKYGINIEVRTVGLYLQKHPIYTVGQTAQAVCEFIEKGDKLLEETA